MNDLIPGDGLPDVVDLLVRLVESAGAVVISAGAAIAFLRFVVAAVRDRDAAQFVPVRLDLGRFLALGLEFSSPPMCCAQRSRRPSREIGELAAVAVIRTALNFFLAHEIREEREEVADRQEQRR